MTMLKIKDNSCALKTDFEKISSLTNKIADKTLDQLEKEGVFVFPETLKEAENITKEQMLLQSFNSFYRTSNLMGFVGSGKEQLNIESRFSNSENDYLFQYLLETVLDFPNILNLNTNSDIKDKVFNLLLFLFSRYLKSAMRKGAFKMYTLNKYNDSNVKGNIDLARHIKTNTPFTGKIAYNQREFSYDNYVMQLVRHTIEFIKTKSYGQKLLNTAKDEVDVVIKATDKYKYSLRQKTIETNKKNPIRHAYYHEYRELQRLCIMILQNENHNIGIGSREIYGILFDGAWLWEEYTNLLVKDIFYHPMNKGGKDAQKLFNRNTGLIYPDFISKNSENRIIADAKYKPVANIANKDYLQILAYMLRFNAKTGLYFYPELSETNALELKLNKGSTYEKNVMEREDLSVVKCGLFIPDNTFNYQDFKLKIAESEEEFMKNILRLVSKA